MEREYAPHPALPSPVDLPLFLCYRVRFGTCDRGFWMSSAPQFRDEWSRAYTIAVNVVVVKGRLPVVTYLPPRNLLFHNAFASHEIS